MTPASPIPLPSKSSHSIAHVEPLDSGRSREPRGHRRGARLSKRGLAERGRPHCFNGVAIEVEPLQVRDRAQPLGQCGAASVSDCVVLQVELLEKRNTRESLGERARAGVADGVAAEVELGQVGCSAGTEEGAERRRLGVAPSDLAVLQPSRHAEPCGLVLELVVEGGREDGRLPALRAHAPQLRPLDRPIPGHLCEVERQIVPLHHHGPRTLAKTPAAPKVWLGVARLGVELLVLVVRRKGGEHQHHGGRVGVEGAQAAESLFEEPVLGGVPPDGTGSQTALFLRELERRALRCAAAVTAALVNAAKVVEDSVPPAPLGGQQALQRAREDSQVVTARVRVVRL
eukprot:scaffold1864_cov106-Isochrysis_galbana.AAC.16